MRLSKGEEYGVRLAMSMATAGRQVTVSELAERESLPEPTVAKVLSNLRRAGVVEASRGCQGGYELAQTPDETSVRSILRAIDGPLFEGSFCRQDAADEASCVHQGACSLLPVWQQLELLIDTYLERISLAELVSGRVSARIPVAIAPPPRRSGDDLAGR